MGNRIDTVILAEFDNPRSSAVDVDGLDSSVDTIRPRVQLEVLLDNRQWLKKIHSLLETIEVNTRK